MSQVWVNYISGHKSNNMTQYANWKKIKEIFTKALELEAEERISYIRKECRGDTQLMEEVLSLLDAHDMNGAIDQPIDTLRMSAITNSKNDLIKGRKIDKYKIIKELGYGGMGNVYLAERADGQFEQYVALKVLRTGMFVPDQSQRFLAERQILASLNHKNIARLYDGGITDQGQPYIVMEYIEGKPIDQYCDSKQLTIRERLDLFLDVCEAVQYAHGKLIVHRDLKPSNILVTKDGVVKLLDFGIAKVLNSKELTTNRYINLTQTSLLPLTPAYASPEQVQKDVITTASDIYQLGLVLYKLLTGCHPYKLKNKSPGRIEKIICEQPPNRPSSILTGSHSLLLQSKSVPNSFLELVSNTRKTNPSQLKKQLTGDLDTIVLKTLEKEPDLRYKSTGHLMDDIRRYLESVPIIARPGTVGYRFGKWCKRNRILATATLVVFLSLSIGIGLAVWQTRIANQAAEQANVALAETEQALNRAESLHNFLLDLFSAAEPDRPRDQLPSTEELLALGAQRALDQQTTTPAIRNAMLLAIGEVYVALGRDEQAQPLLNAVIENGTQHTNEQPGDLARAMSLKAVIAMREFRISGAEEWLLEAESLTIDNQQTWNEFAKIREQLAQLESMRGNFKKALAFIEPVYQDIGRNNELKPDIHYRIGSRLESIYRTIGDFDAALKVQTEITELGQADENSESFLNAVKQASLAGTQFQMGDFEESETNLREAINLYDQIFEHPTEYRAIALIRLGLIYFHTGQYEYGLDVVTQSAKEWAIVQGRQPEDHEFGYFLIGEMLLQIQRWSDAKEHLLKARALFRKIEDDSNNWVLMINAMLANIACRSGNTDEGLELLRHQNGDNDFMVDGPAYQSKINESRAVCLYQKGETNSALDEINTSLEIFNFPGYAIVHAQRKLLKADILNTLGQLEEATSVLKDAENLFLDLGLNEHPYLGNIEQARNEFEM